MMACFFVDWRSDGPPTASSAPNLFVLFPPLISAIGGEEAEEEEWCAEIEPNPNPGSLPYPAGRYFFFLQLGPGPGLGTSSDPSPGHQPPSICSHQNSRPPFFAPLIYATKN